VSDPTSIEELLAECSNVYTREQFEADRTRIVARICEKHGIVESEVEGLIARHDYVHDAEDIEQEWIEMMAMARHIGWVPTGQARYEGWIVDA